MKITTVLYLSFHFICFILILSWFFFIRCRVISHYYNILVQVIEAGANALVAGSAVFGAPDYAEGKDTAASSGVY